MLSRLHGCLCPSFNLSITLSDPYKGVEGEGGEEGSQALLYLANTVQRWNVLFGHGDI